MTDTKFQRIDGAAFSEVFLEGPFRKSGTSVAVAGMAAAPFMDQQTLIDAYTWNGFARRIIDKPAEEMTRAGFKIDGVKDETVNAYVQSRFEELGIMAKLCLALKWSRAFGGSAIVLGVKDGRWMTQPLNVKPGTELDFLRVYDRFELSEVRRYSQPTNPKFGQVEIWRVSPTGNGRNVPPYEVHESRVLTFDGEDVPNSLRMANEGWGASCVQKCWTQLQRMNNAQRWAELLLERSQQAVHKIPELASLLAEQEGKSLLLKRVAIADMVRSAQNTMVLDAQEEYEIHSLSLTGVHEVLDRFAEAVSAVTGIPVFVLMGRSPGGLNATSEGNEDAWFADVGNMQKSSLLRPLVTLVEIMLAEMKYTPAKIEEPVKPEPGGPKMGSELPPKKTSKAKKDAADPTDETKDKDTEKFEQWKICFEPLKVPSEKDAAETASKKAAALKSEADALNVFVNAGGLDASELRSYIASKPELAEHIDATIEPEPPAQKLLEQELEGQQNAVATRAGSGSGSSGGK